MRETTLTKIKNFKATAQAYGFEVETSKTESGGIILFAQYLKGDLFELVWDAQGRFAYGPSLFNSKRVRNLSEAIRLLERYAPTHNKVVLQGTEKSIALYARKYDTTADNKVGYAPKRLYTNVPVTPNHHRCDTCEIPNIATQRIALIAPQIRLVRNPAPGAPGTYYKGYNAVRFEFACDSCAEKHTAER